MAPDVSGRGRDLVVRPSRTRRCCPTTPRRPRTTSIVVELADAPRIRLVGNLVTAPDAPLDSVDPARLRIGARVQVVFTETGGMAVPRWLLERP